MPNLEGERMREASLSLPITEIQFVFQACDPGEPLEPGDKRYADLSALRKGIGISMLEKELLVPSAKGRCRHYCLCGHRGSGKSTELLSLKKWADENGFLAVRTEVDQEYGMIDLEFSDLFLLAATTAEEAMEAFKHPLPQEKRKRVIEWFAEVTSEENEAIKSEISAEVTAQLGGGFSIAKLIAKVKAGLKGTSEHAIKVHQKLKNYPDKLVDLTNDLLETANSILAKEGKARGLLLLFDNLDRYEPNKIDRVLFKNSELIRRMACHAVFTFPIALEYEPLSGTPQDCYGYPLVLPMLSLRKKSDIWAATIADSKFDESAVENVRQALARRIDINRLFEKPEDADLLIKMSGGCIRDLMHLVTLAFRHVPNGGKQFTPTAVEKAVRTMRAAEIRQLTAEDYRRLAAIARRQPVADDKEDEKQQNSRLLFRRYALEYMDEDDRPWIDVHPLIIEIEEFRHDFDSKSPVATR
jgi:hypothetical protein